MRHAFRTRLTRKGRADGTVHGEKGADPGRRQRFQHRLGDQPEAPRRGGGARLHPPARRQDGAARPQAGRPDRRQAASPPATCRRTRTSPGSSTRRARLTARSTSCCTRSRSPRSTTSSARSSNASREGFKTAMDISVYSLAIVARHAAESMPDGGAIVTLTYFGGERVVPGYNMMGVCKAALDAAVQVPGLRPRAEEDPGQRRLGRAGQDAGGLGRRRLRQARRALRDGRRRWAATSPARRSARPACSCSPTSPAGSPARSSTSTAATTSWARPAGRSRASASWKVKAANPERRHARRRRAQR